MGKDLGLQLFSPDLILREAEQIELTGPQRDAVLDLVSSMKRTMKERQTKLAEAAAELRKTLEQPTVPRPVALNQFASMLEIENELKRDQFDMLVQAKNLLSVEQQNKVRTLAPKQPLKGGTRDIRWEINLMMQKVQSGIENWRKEGRDPAPILEVMKPFGDQMQEGKFPEAKETLGKALQLFSQPKGR